MPRSFALTAFLLVGPALTTPLLAQRADSLVTLPARFVAHRIFVRPVTERGDTLNLYTDSGGGLWLDAGLVSRLGLPTAIGFVRGADTLRTVKLPPFRPGQGIPDPRGFADGRLRVIDGAGVGGTMTRGWSGMLGQEWFAERVWTFDYPRQRLILHSGSAPAGDPAHTVALGFQEKDGGRALDFPRIRVEIDGDSIDLLFDTGATAVLPPAALSALGDDGPSERATSFITTEIFDRWHARHPDWRVIEDADQVPGMAIIQVPRVSVAGFTVGPVWFTQRPDKNFHTYMTQFMDRRIDGALGGSALQYFRVTVDYPRALAIFERAP